MGMFITSDQIEDIIGRINSAEDGFDLWCCCYKEMRDEESCDDNLSEFANACGASFWEVGMTKICMFFKEYADFVIKIPLQGCTCYHDDYDDDGYITVVDDCGTTYDYENAVVGETERSWDYCASEQYVYEQAVVRGVSDMFAQTIRIGKTKSGYPVYASERIDSHSSKMTKRRRDQCMTYIKENNVDTGFLGKYVVSDLIVSYPILMVIDVIKFMRELDIDRDMHSQNYNYDENGDIVFIDYSDFNDHTEEF